MLRFIPTLFYPKTAEGWAPTARLLKGETQIVDAVQHGPSVKPIGRLTIGQAIHQAVRGRIGPQKLSL